MSKLSKVKRVYKNSFVDEFKEFAFKGNLIELAVGIIIGTAFNKLVQSLITDIIMPPIGKLLGNTSFSNLYINLSDTTYSSLNDAIEAGAPVIKYGLFINELINFIILAITVFLVIKFVLRVKREEKE